jgi:predicted Fe-Mo cluster-binding NifX family protein
MAVFCCKGDAGCHDLLCVNMLSGPGEAQEVLVFDTSTGRELDRYENPAPTATSGRGIAMIRSLLERKAEAIVVSGIGQHAFEVARRTLKVLNGEGLTLGQIVQEAAKGTLPELTEPSHSMHSH